MIHCVEIVEFRVSYVVRLSGRSTPDSVPNIKGNVYF